MLPAAVYPYLLSIAYNCTTSVLKVGIIILSGQGHFRFGGFFRFYKLGAICTYVRALL